LAWRTKVFGGKKERKLYDILKVKHSIFGGNRGGGGKSNGTGLRGMSWRRGKQELM